MDAYQDSWLRALDKLGEVIFKDDEKDFPRFSFESHPSPLHHWQVGLAMRGGATVLRTLLQLFEVIDAVEEDPRLHPIEAELEDLLRRA